MQDTDLMLHTLLELGESMLADGADVRRVEQTLSRMGKAYGAVRMDVFVITSSIVLTMCFADGSAATQTRRIEKSAMTDFGKLEAINAISRSYCEHPFPVPELYDRLQLAKRCEPARWKLFAGSCLAAGALAVFFGGTALDGLAAGLFALVLCCRSCCRRYVRTKCCSTFFRRSPSAGSFVLRAGSCPRCTATRSSSAISCC